MDIQKKCGLVEILFEEIDREISLYQNSSGIKCAEHCRGECCNKNDIFATVLEFIPLAFFLHSEGLADRIFTETVNAENGLCVLYLRESGKCMFYIQRGLLCRLFGFSSVRDKNGGLQVVTCRQIKSEYRESLKSNPCNIVMSDWYRRLSAIDLHLGTELLHINEAIKTAIEQTGIFLRYR
ncbi:MAG: YkgJ family cysteine cluster protein [Deltaproteobacteria bacterium]|nr:YkgJ family cysteine cluster protein [Deltaproteobacteria bacterium]